MALIYEKSSSHSKPAIGRGLLNKAINSLPFELHLPGYQFCVPGTKLKNRLARDDRGINPLDAACKEQDIAYSQSKDLSKRHETDTILAEKAFRRSISKDTNHGERINAFLVANAMKAKLKVGIGNKLNKTFTKINKKKKFKATCVKKIFTKTVKNALKNNKHRKPEDIPNAIKMAQGVIKKSFGRKKSLIEILRVIPIPKIGVFLPLVTILTALGAVGGVASGGAINETKAARKQLKGASRHNQTIAIAMGKGLYPKPYRKGLGLYYHPQPKNF